MTADRLRPLPYAIAFVLAGSTALYAIAAAITSAPWLILVLDGLALVAAVAVCGLYGPFAFAALRRRAHPTRADWFAIGILASGVAVIQARAMSLVARSFGWIWLYGTDVETARLALTLAGLLAFLAAPFAGPGPRPSWRRLSVWLMAGLGLAALALRVAPH